MAIVIGDYQYILWTNKTAAARVVDKTKASYEDIPNTITYNNVTYTVTDLNGCYYQCSSLVNPPVLPTGAIDIQFCFAFCHSLTSAPVIPDGVTNMRACFEYCELITTAPDIPSKVTDVQTCFSGCTDLTGDIVVRNNPITYDSVFSSTISGLNIVPDLTEITPEGIEKWTMIADSYEGVTISIPSVSFQTFNAYRVDSPGDTTESEEGAYVLLEIQYAANLPVGDSVVKTVTANGGTITPTWTDTTVDGVTTSKAWVSQAVSSQVAYAIKLTDSNGLIETETKIITVVKVEALIDFLDGSQGMGIAFGTIATQTGFECAMDAIFNNTARFKDLVIIDRLIGEIKLFAGATVPAGWHLCDGSELAKDDYPLLYNAIGDAWGTPTDSDNFVLPNLMGRVPVGAGLGTASDATSRIVGQMDGRERVTLDVTQIPSHNHVVNYVNYNRGSGSNATMGYLSSSSQSNHANTENTGGGQSHENMQPYAVVNYIICCSV